MPGFGGSVLRRREATDGSDGLAESGAREPREPREPRAGLAGAGGGNRGNTWLSPSMVLDPWRWLRDNEVRYTAQGRFVSATDLAVAGFGTAAGVCDLSPDLSALCRLVRFGGGDDRAEGGGAEGAEGAGGGGGDATLRPAGPSAGPSAGLRGVCDRSRYFAPMRDAMGRVDVPFHSAPYDFRRIMDPAVASEYRARVTALVARARAAAGGRRVVLVAHSMGCAVANALLLSDSNGLGRAWVEDNVAHVVDICPADHGSVSALDCMLNGKMYVGDARGALREALCASARSNAGMVLSLPIGLGRAVDPADGYSALVGDAWTRHAEPLLRSLASPARPGKVGHVVIDGTGHPTATAIDGAGQPCGFVDGDGVVLRGPGGGAGRAGWAGRAGRGVRGPNSIHVEVRTSHSVAPSHPAVIATVRLLAGA